MIFRQCGQDTRSKSYREFDKYTKMRTRHRNIHKNGSFSIRHLDCFKKKTQKRFDPFMHGAKKYTNFNYLGAYLTI